MFVAREYWDEFWTQRGRFRKFSKACKCSICSAVRYRRKYRRKGRRVDETRRLSSTEEQ